MSQLQELSPEEANRMLAEMKNQQPPPTEEDAFAAQLSLSHSDTLPKPSGDLPPHASPAERAKADAVRREKIPRANMNTLADFPPVRPEDEDSAILIHGRWLERGCGAFLISTAGTGKSIWATQFALSVFHGVPFSGLQPTRPFRVWVFQCEDSDTRISIDREDILKKLKTDYPNLNWDTAAQNVKFLEFPGLTGADFIEALENELYQCLMHGIPLPDCIIINPFFGFIGGDIIRDAGAFFRGGRIGGKQTMGLQAVLKKYNIAALILHHTGKPPTANELKNWLSSPMPEYQSCGSSEITNWGRSFITMMKIPKVSGMVTLTAGKNGGALGWPEIDGLPRMFLAHGLETSVSGIGQAHYWRKPEPNEIPSLSAFVTKNPPKEDPEGERKATLAVFTSAQGALTMTVAVKRVQEAVKAFRKSIKAKKTSFSKPDAKTAIEDIAADNHIAIRHNPKGGQMVGTPKTISEWEKNLELLPTQTGGIL